jgi:hypothetical protein
MAPAFSAAHQLGMDPADEAKYTITHKNNTRRRREMQRRPLGRGQVGKRLRVFGQPGPDMDKWKIMLYLAEKR